MRRTAQVQAHPALPLRCLSAAEEQMGAVAAIERCQRRSRRPPGSPQDRIRRGAAGARCRAHRGGRGQAVRTLAGAASSVAGASHVRWRFTASGPSRGISRQAAAEFRPSPRRHRGCSGTLEQTTALNDALGSARWVTSSSHIRALKRALTGALAGRLPASPAHRLQRHPAGDHADRRHRNDVTQLLADPRRRAGARQGRAVAPARRAAANRPRL
jgi:hypothetical protein